MNLIADVLNIFFGIKSKEFSLPTTTNYQKLTEHYHLNHMDGYLTYREMENIHQNFLPIFNLNDKKIMPDMLKFHKPTKRFHPTQKPVALLEYLIKTYTNEGMTVLDNVMGSGSTGVAAKLLNRNFIGIEKEKKYFEIAKKRINEA